MRLLAACSLGGAGHLQPLLPFLRAARAGGHETLVVAPASLSNMVAEAGFPLAAGDEPQEAVVAPIRERLPVASREEASRLANGELFGRLATGALLPTLEAAALDWRPTLVLREPCEYASAVVAARLGLRTAQVAISLAQAELAATGLAAPALEELQPGVGAALRAWPYLSRFPPSFDPSPFASTLRYRDPSTAPGEPPPWLARFWGGGSTPRIYLSFGTVLAYLSMAPGLYRAALQAVGSLDARVLLTIGRHLDPAELGEVPPNVRVERWVDQSELLGSADLVVCHGGSGTVLGALAAGVPLVAVPLFADQFENARRVEATGAGVAIAPADPAAPGDPPTIEPARLRSAIDEVLSDPRYGSAAAVVATEMAAAPPAAELLERLAG